MILNLLFQSPISFFIWVFAIIYGITIHEFSHALAGKILGDNTAEQQGRLTLNPIAHIDPFGLLLLFLVGFGWGRPTPFNPHNLKFKNFGPAIVAIFGPLSNLVSIIVFVIIARVLQNYIQSTLLFAFLGTLIIINLALMVFNLIPIPPLDGSRILFAFLPRGYDELKMKLELQGPWALFLLIILDSFLGLNLFGKLFHFVLNLTQRLSGLT